ncbi:MAG: site-2 protease family protein [Armatimonadetes bacterium]|nr:site-2 protease family protein [Armatimonadota bacterium]
MASCGRPRRSWPWPGIGWRKESLLGLTERLFDRSPQEWAFLGLALLIAIPIHEFAHAIAARWAGDHTAEDMGRVTLDPLKHLDPVGTFLILLGGFGWGKPVPVNPANFRSPRWGSVLVSAAGPASNILLALALGVIGFRLGLLQHVGFTYQSLAVQLIGLNLGLAFFNLIPVPPLDGSHVLVGLLPGEQAIRVAKVLEQGGLLLLILIVFTGLTGVLIGPPVRLLLGLFTGLW